MTARERRRALIASLGLAAALSLPYLFAWGITPPERAWLGHIWNPDEPNVYYSWMRQAADGKVFLEDLFTTEPQEGRFTNVFLLGLGWCAALTRLPVPLVYGLARFACAALLLYSVHRFLHGLGATRPTRWAAFWLAGTASGLGWLAVALGPVLPPGLSFVDIGLETRASGIAEGLMMPEANTFASALLLPLFSFSMSLLLAIVLLGSRAIREGRLRDAVGAGLLGLLLGSVHTYDLVPLHLLLGALAAIGAWRQRCIRPITAYVVFALLSLPSLAYQVWVFSVDEVFHAKAVTVTASPTPASYAVSFGLPLLLALAGAWFVARRREARWTPVALWLAIGLAVAFLPGLSFQRKMIEGVHLPMAMLAAVALTRQLPALLRGMPRARAARTLALAGVLLCAPSSVVLVGGRCLASVVDNNRARMGAMMPPYSVSRDDLAAALWLREHAGREDAILCLPYLGSYVPGLTGRKVWIGHWAETLGFAERKLPAALAALRGQPEGAEALDACQWLVVGEYERALGARPDPIRLDEAFRAGQTVVYRVREGVQVATAPEPVYHASGDVRRVVP